MNKTSNQLPERNFIYKLLFQMKTSNMFEPQTDFYYLSAITRAFDVCEFLD